MRLLPFALILLTLALARSQEDVFDAIPHPGSDVKNANNAEKAGSSTAAAEATAEGFLDKLSSPYRRLMGMYQGAQDAVHKPINQAAEVQESLGGEFGSDEDWKDDL